MKKTSLYFKIIPPCLFFAAVFPLAFCGCDIWNVPLSDRVAFELKVKLVSSWAELEDAVNNAQNGDIIAITRSFSTVDASGIPIDLPISITKDITITSYRGRETIYRENGWEFGFFGINDGARLTLGHPLGGTLVLDGKGIPTTSSALVQVGFGSSFVLADGAELRNNCNNSEGGGAVSVEAGGTFTMTGGIISGNNILAIGSSGGGVHVLGTFTMTGGTISGNDTLGGGSGSVGGGVFVLGAFTMTGGTISGNRAYSVGGGVYVQFGAVFSKSGPSSISGNVLMTAGMGDNVGAIQNDGSLKKRNSDAGPGQDISVVPSGTAAFTYSGFDN